MLLREPSRARLTVLLISSENALIRVLRTISLSPEVTRELWMRVEMQRSSTFPTDYDALLQGAYAQFSPEQMAAAGIICVGGE